ncbi:hypothetical protein ATG71_4544 [Bacillus sp. es.034]|jgi:hypothetical protein|nr:hypothetical protein ATG71_4544 [Bacillus sp. es.034]
MKRDAPKQNGLLGGIFFLRKATGGQVPWLLHHIFESHSLLNSTSDP